MNSENTKTSDWHRLLLNLTNKIDLRRKDKYIAFVKGYGFLSFARNIGKNVGKNITKNLSSKCCQKRLDCATGSATDPLKTASKRTIKKTAQVPGDLIGNEIVDKITRVSKTSSENNWSKWRRNTKRKIQISRTKI